MPAEPEGVRKGGRRGRGEVGGGWVGGELRREGRVGESGRTCCVGVPLGRPWAGEDILSDRRQREKDEGRRMGSQMPGIKNDGGKGSNGDGEAHCEHLISPVWICITTGLLLATVVFGFLSHRNETHRGKQTCDHTTRPNSSKGMGVDVERRVS